MSLSAVARYADTDAIAAAQAIKVPAVFVASEFDGSFPDTARRLAHCSCRKVLIFDGSHHGAQLRRGDATDVHELIDQLFATLS